MSPLVYRPSVPAATPTEEVTTVPMLDVTQLYLNGKAMTGKLIQELGMLLRRI